jgi:hypothetical protein
MLTSRQIAKELISRKHQNPDTTITTSSYEMIDPVDADTSDDAPRRDFWGLNLRKRGNIHDMKYTENGRRVVSEPLPAGLRKMAVLRRFRFGRHDQDLEEEEGDLTISTETVCPFILYHAKLIPGHFLRTRGYRGGVFNLISKLTPDTPKIPWYQPINRSWTFLHLFRICLSVHRRLSRP